jgi:carboxypeptidase C (cathepsin A)
MTDKDDDTKTPANEFSTEGATTDHSIELDGVTLNYRAIAEWISLRKVHKPVAEMFHTAYLADTDDGQDRPITFVFNGGPGAASAYLHMGALGPQRVAFGPNGKLPQPPTQVVDNTETWLKFSDLVFIDPIGTGFSRSLKEDSKPDEKKNENAGPEENPEFWEIEKDLDSLGEFIKRFLSKHHRWTSPIFIAGESYGGYRVAKMARRLQETHGVGLSGALLISPAIEIDGLIGSDYDMTCWVELFPSLVTTAFQHGRTKEIAQDLSADDVRQLAESFAQNELVRWLTQGDRLPSDERASIIQRITELTGLPQQLVERLEGRISATSFCRELLRDQRRLCGHYDASVSTVDPFPDRNGYEGPDPSLFSIDRLFSGSINHHLRATLNVETDLDYRLLSMQVNESWKDDKRTHVFNKMTGSLDDLRYGMSLNEHMKVFISHGYFDLITPYFSSGRLTQLMKLTRSQQDNLVNKNYLGGHMYYSWDESRIAFRDDAQAFYASATK